MRNVTSQYQIGILVPRSAIDGRSRHRVGRSGVQEHQAVPSWPWRAPADYRKRRE